VPSYRPAASLLASLAPESRVGMARVEASLHAILCLLPYITWDSIVHIEDLMVGTVDENTIDVGLTEQCHWLEQDIDFLLIVESLAKELYGVCRVAPISPDLSVLAGQFPSITHCIRIRAAHYGLSAL
jgi:hypothetical protein